jgi:hypothetical protein
VINVAAFNSPPVIAPSGPFTIADGTLLKDTLHATDPDQDVLRWRLFAGPQGALLDSVKGVITWTPGRTQRGSNSITAIVTDGDLKDTVTVLVTVTNGNLPPQISMTFPDTVLTDSLYLFPLVATDPNHDSVIWTVAQKPSGMERLDTILAWLPVAGDVGRHFITLIASDGEMADTLRDSIVVKNRRITGVRRVAGAGLPARLFLSPKISATALEFSIGIPGNGAPAAELSICDARGRLVHRQMLHGVGIHRVSIDRRKGGMLSGVYILRLMHGTEAVVQRLAVR